MFLSEKKNEQQKIFKMEEKTLLELKALLWTFFPVAWMGHLGLGLTYGLMGPAQPYLARYRKKV